MVATFIYPNQLFDPHPALSRNRKIFLFEDPLYFGDKRYPINFNKKKLLLHFLSMASYDAKLKNRGFSSEIIPFTQLRADNYISSFIKSNQITNIHISEVVDYELNKRINEASKETRALIHWYDNPNFLLSNSDVKDEFKDKKFYFMANFYKKQRKRYNILLTPEGKPSGNNGVSMERIAKSSRKDWNSPKII